jgi:hypothetical protein
LGSAVGIKVWVFINIDSKTGRRRNTLAEVLALRRRGSDVDVSVREVPHKEEVLRREALLEPRDQGASALRATQGLSMLGVFKNSLDMSLCQYLAEVHIQSPRLTNLHP